MDLWPSSTFRDRLWLEYPIVQAPMAQISRAELVAAVSNAGGLGSLASAVMPKERIREQVGAIREHTQQAFALNFFVHEPPPAIDAARAAALSQRLTKYREALGIGEQLAPFQQPPFDDAMLALVLELRPRAVSFHFGLPAAHAVSALKGAGILLMGAATTVAEAVALERAGFDAVVAQGSEAGGHRGTFAEPFEQGVIGLMSLVPQVVDAVRVPVIAAGGIADGRGIAAAFMLGASAVQLGTAFLGTPEAAVDATFRRVLREPRATDTRITRVFTGRPARAITTRFIEEMADQEGNTLAYPLQRAYTAPLGQAGLARQNPEFHSLFAGQSAALVRPLPAAALIETLVAETERALARRGA